MGPMSCRERNMMNIMSYVVTQKSSMSASLAILDKSQSIDRTQFRDDGVVPTVCTTSSLWAFALGRELKAAEIACLFGHKATPFGGQTEAGLKFLLGNSMHLAEARVCVCAFLHVSAGICSTFAQVGTLLSTITFLRMGLIGR